jgi:hypothetical protein
MPKRKHQLNDGQRRAERIAHWLRPPLVGYYPLFHIVGGRILFGLPAPGAVVVGSTTAGADGNVSSVPLPGGLRTMISGIGGFPRSTPARRSRSWRQGDNRRRRPLCGDLRRARHDRRRAQPGHCGASAFPCLNEPRAYAIRASAPR